MNGYPYNESGQTPKQYTCIGIILLVIGQILLNYLQKKLNKRLLPKFLMPKRYNTIETLKVDVNNPESMKECAICLISFDIDPQSISNPNHSETELESCVTKTVRVIRTLCNQYYHIDCLNA
jgi:hypothetical protein